MRERVWGKEEGFIVGADSRFVFLECSITLISMSTTVRSLKFVTVHVFLFFFSFWFKKSTFIFPITIIHGTGKREMVWKKKRREDIPFYELKKL